MQLDDSSQVKKQGWSRHGKQIAQNMGEHWTGGCMPGKVSEVRTVYLPLRHKEVRCRLWYEVTPLRDGLYKYFLLGIEELE